MNIRADCVSSKKTPICSFASCGRWMMYLFRPHEQPPLRCWVLMVLIVLRAIKWQKSLHGLQNNSNTQEEVYEQNGLSKNLETQRKFVAAP